MARTPAKQGPGTGLVTWQERLASMAKESVEQEASVTSGQFISTKAGQLSWAGNPVNGNVLDVIVIDAILENAYYESDFDDDNPQPPVCFAFGRSDKDMAPHKDSTEPQAESCAACPQNVFGSAQRGKGKACKNIRRLALIPAKPLDEVSLRKSEIAYMKLPVTSVKGWAAYVRSLEALSQRPPQGVITQIGSMPDPKTQYKITFNLVNNVPDKLMGVVFERHDEVKELIEFPYQPMNSEEPAPKKGARNRTSIPKGAVVKPMAKRNKY